MVVVNVNYILTQKESNTDILLLQKVHLLYWCCIGALASGHGGLPHGVHGGLPLASTLFRIVYVQLAIWSRMLLSP